MEKAKTKLIVGAFFCWVFGLVFFGLGCSSRASAMAAEEFEAMTEEELEERSKRRAEAVEAYEVLYLSFWANDSGMPEYPKDYSGAYIDEEGNLHILLTDLEGETRKEYEEMLAEWSHKIIYEQATYSYTELEQIPVSIWEFYEDLNWYAYGVDEKINRVFLELAAEDIETLKERLSEAGKEDLPLDLLEGSPATFLGGSIQPEPEEELLGQGLPDGEELSEGEGISEEGNISSKEDKLNGAELSEEENLPAGEKRLRFGTILWILALVLVGAGSAVVVQKRKKRGV